METQRHGWDTRAWAFGFVAGNACGGALLALSDTGARSNSGLFRQNVIIASAVVAVIAFLIVPGLTSALARRRTFWWGLLPLSLLALWLIDIDHLRNNGSTYTGTGWWILPATVSGFLVVSSGPVSLIRWLLRRARERRTEAAQAAERLRAAASVSQEGVWPPPPEYHS